MPASIQALHVVEQTLVMDDVEKVSITWVEEQDDKSLLEEYCKHARFPTFLLDDVYCAPTAMLLLYLHAERRTGLALYTRIENFFICPRPDHGLIHAVINCSGNEIIFKLRESGFIAWWLPKSLCLALDASIARVREQETIDISAVDLTSFDDSTALNIAMVERSGKISDMHPCICEPGEIFLYNKQFLNLSHGALLSQLACQGNLFVSRILGEYLPEDSVWFCNYPNQMDVLVLHFHFRKLSGSEREFRLTPALLTHGAMDIRFTTKAIYCFY